MTFRSSPTTPRSRPRAVSPLTRRTHPGVVELDGDTAAGRAYVLSLGCFRDGGSHLNYSVYHDRYQRTPDGWKFTERVDEVKYVDTTPLTGSPPPLRGKLALSWPRIRRKTRKEINYEGCPRSPANRHQRACLRRGA
jgi:hypothetical protein